MGGGRGHRGASPACRCFCGRRCGDCVLGLEPWGLAGMLVRGACRPSPVGASEQLSRGWRWGACGRAVQHCCWASFPRPRCFIPRGAARTVPASCGPPTQKHAFLWRFLPPRTCVLEKSQSFCCPSRLLSQAGGWGCQATRSGLLGPGARRPRASSWDGSTQNHWSGQGVQEWPSQCRLVIEQSLRCKFPSALDKTCDPGQVSFPSFQFSHLKNVLGAPRAGKRCVSTRPAARAGMWVSSRSRAAGLGCLEVPPAPRLVSCSLSLLKCVLALGSCWFE